MQANSKPQHQQYNTRIPNWISCKAEKSTRQAHSTSLHQHFISLQPKSYSPYCHLSFILCVIMQGLGKF